MNIIVTGGAGFIGANFVHYLADKYGADAQITVVDKLTYAGNPENISALTDGRHAASVRLVRADICDAGAMNAVVKESDAHFIVNFAAESHVDRSILSPTEFVRTNVLGTQTIMDAARSVWRRHDGSYPPGRMFVQVSTDEVYGALDRTYDTPQPLKIDKADYDVFSRHRNDKPMTFGDKLFTEETPLSPRSPYSASKASADMLVLASHHTFGFPAAITRCSNNYGPMQFPEKLIPLLINNILNGKELPVYGKGLNVRDWLYVDDHCRAIDTVMQHGTPGQVYNIGGYNEKQNIDIVRTVVDIVAELTGTPARHDLVRFVADRAGHDMRYAIKPSKIAAQLGWAPAVPFDEGIRRTVRWYLDNKQWMDNVTSGDYLTYYNKMYNHTNA